MDGPCARAHHHRRRLCGGRCGHARLQPRDGHRGAGHAQTHPRRYVLAHADAPLALLRHTRARRHHEPLHQRHRHPAPDDRAVALAARKLGIHAGRGLCVHALDERGAHRGGLRAHGGDTRVRGPHHGGHRVVFYRAARYARRAQRLHRGDGRRAEGRQGLLSRGHRTHRNGQAQPCLGKGCDERAGRGQFDHAHDERAWLPDLCGGGCARRLHGHCRDTQPGSYRFRHVHARCHRVVSDAHA